MRPGTVNPTSSHTNDKDKVMHTPRPNTTATAITKSPPADYAQTTLFPIPGDVVVGGAPGIDALAVRRAAGRRGPAKVPGSGTGVSTLTTQRAFGAYLARAWNLCANPDHVVPPSAWMQTYVDAWPHRADGTLLDPEDYACLDGAPIYRAALQSEVFSIDPSGVGIGWTFDRDTAIEIAAAATGAYAAAGFDVTCAVLVTEFKHDRLQADYRGFATFHRARDLIVDTAPGPAGLDRHLDLTARFDAEAPVNPWTDEGSEALAPHRHHDLVWFPADAATGDIRVDAGATRTSARLVAAHRRNHSEEEIMARIDPVYVDTAIPAVVDATNTLPTSVLRAAIHGARDRHVGKHFDDAVYGARLADAWALCRNADTALAPEAWLEALAPLPPHDAGGRPLDAEQLRALDGVTVYRAAFDAETLGGGLGVGWTTDFDLAVAISEAINTHMLMHGLDHYCVVLEATVNAGGILADYHESVHDGLAHDLICDPSCFTEEPTVVSTEACIDDNEPAVA